MEMKHLSVISWPARRKSLNSTLLSCWTGRGDISAQKQCPGTWTPKLFGISSVQSSFQGEVRAGYMGGESIFYSVPVYGVDGAVSEVLVGVRSKKDMQSMIASKSFNGDMLSCIVDSRGQVVISPSELKPFLRLDDIFRSGKEQKAAGELRNMQDDMKQGKDGILEFSAVTKEELFLSYNSLDINDWFLLTIIPAGIISGGAQRYILQTFLIIGILIVIFFLFLNAIYRFYHSHRMQLERLAFEDPLTGGANQAAFELRYRELAPGMKPGIYTIAVMDVRHFKMINERFGIHAGNRVLAYLYRVMEGHLREDQGEFMARSESDRFFLCLRGCGYQEIRDRLDGIIRDINSFLIRIFQDTPFHSGRAPAWWRNRGRRLPSSRIGQDWPPRAGIRIWSLDVCSMMTA